MTDLPLYVYIDESGNFDFSAKGTKHFCLTGLITHHPEILSNEIVNLKHDILSKQKLPRLEKAYLDNHLSRKFHASEDRQPVRNLVFNTITSLPEKYIKAVSIVAQKNKANPTIRKPVKFYEKLMVPLMKFILKGFKCSNIIFFLDRSPVNTKKQALIKNVKMSLVNIAPDKPYVIYCVPSESNHLLQISDYVNWAIFRKWERSDMRSYRIIEEMLERKELDIFSRGKTVYY